jgi:S1-C subfamily serine protease
MTDLPPQSGPSGRGEGTPDPIRPIIIHLTGPLRGTTQVLSGRRLRIGTGAISEIHFPADRAPSVAEHHAELRLEDSSYTIVTAPGEIVRVNGERVDQARLAAADVLEIGEAGPVLRFRIHRGPDRPYKTLSEALADCRDGARRSGAGRIGRLVLLLAGLPRELLTQTGPTFRALAGLSMLALMVAVILLGLESWSLRRQLEAESSMRRDIGALLEQTEANSLTEEELERIRSDLEAQLAERLEALEERSLDARRVISDASRSVVLLQGAYGFFEASTGRPLRLTASPGELPAGRIGSGSLLGVEGDGPEYERQFTGTAFLATEGGFLLTNRHLAQPWDFDRSSRLLLAEGWEPGMRRFLGYLPGVAEPFELQLLVSSQAVDLAVLCCSPVVQGMAPLELSDSLPLPGDDVVVLSYPTGIQALLARTDAAFVDSIMGDSGRDFWSVARRLSEAGRIAPLATRGIVGQSSPAAVVYDAETTRGSSGGPVMGADGRVQALNVAVMREFDGSNLGVPASAARQILEVARTDADSTASTADSAAAQPDSAVSPTNADERRRSEPR